MQATTAWVASFIQSLIVSELEPPEYLTVSFPVGAPPRINGVRVVERARGLTGGVARPGNGAGSDDSADIWHLEIETHPERAGPGTDVAAVAEGFIAIVPMRVDEYDAALAERLRRRAGALQVWSAGDSVVR